MSLPISSSVSSQTKYIGYYVDSTTSSYKMTKLDGSPQGYAPFFDDFAFTNGQYSCVVLQHAVLHPSKCDDDDIALCSDRVNQGKINFLCRLACLF